MRYRDAKKLHAEDEVQLKESNELRSVLEVEVQEKDVFIRCDDGKLYHHTALR